MEPRINTNAPWFRPAIIGFLAICAALLVWLLWSNYTERYAVTEEDNGAAITRLISARMSGVSQLKVAELSGTVQANAEDVRGFGLLKSNQVVKMPYSVGYYVDLSKVGPGDLEWVEGSRTLIVNAPDVAVERANIDESRRSLVRTNGLIVTREAAEQLSQRTSAGAAAKVAREAQSPERLAQAREKARGVVGRTMRLPLDTLGYGDARVVVTFPIERNAQARDAVDLSRRPEDVIRERQQAR
ncbi:DUF4230 domain-containing protein [Novosphingopyxis sp.]|uniref:DUF4230 domain-containing protein n=1 Tax=Novosphingopyxis sp. TaxID=2709690 RepID=UPI003B598116